MNTLEQIRNILQDCNFFNISHEDLDREVAVDNGTEYMFQATESTFTIRNCVNLPQIENVLKTNGSILEYDLGYSFFSGNTNVEVIVIWNPFFPFTSINDEKIDWKKEGF